ncbi:MAG: hypothetical protein J6C33_11335 [Lachnospiraceae bacterium]|nr:hypothetical protein [Lachnospiraceae bacterium]
MTDREKEIVRKLNHSLYTVEFLEEWIARNDNVFVNAPAALQAMGAKGFYEAVKAMAESEQQHQSMTGREAVRKIICFLWELKIRIKIMPQTEFVKMLNELTAEQKIYAIYFRLF